MPIVADARAFVIGLLNIAWAQPMWAQIFLLFTILAFLRWAVRRSRRSTFEGMQDTWHDTRDEYHYRRMPRDIWHSYSRDEKADLRAESRRRMRHIGNRW